MSEGFAHVMPRLDMTRFKEGMRKVARAVSSLQLAFLAPAHRHQLRHHRREDPVRSVIHAAYDRRRRARRRRR